jgi:hypothetical protein
MCKADLHMDYLQSIHADENPELRDSILELDFNMAFCPSCQKKIFIDDFVLYTDDSSKLFIQKYAAADLENWESILEQSEEQWAMIPDDLKKLNLTRRIVFGPFALKEKILLAEEGLDDTSVEIYKIGLFGQFGEEFFNRRYRLFFYQKSGDDYLFVMVDTHESTEKNMVRVPVKTFQQFVDQSLPDVLKKPLIEHIIKPPFVSMEKMYFASTLIQQALH